MMYEFWMTGLLFNNYFPIKCYVSHFKAICQETIMKNSPCSREWHVFMST